MPAGTTPSGGALLADRVCELLPAAGLVDCPASRAARQAHADWLTDPTHGRAELVAEVAWRAQFYLLDDARRDLDEALREWSRAQRGVRPTNNALIVDLAARYGKEP